MDKELKIIYGAWIFIVASSIIILPFISSSPALSDGLVSYYKLDEQDTTGSGMIYDALYLNNGTNVGASNSTGKINTAYEFDGDNDVIVLPASESLDITDEICISVWVYPYSYGEGTYGRIVDKREGTGTFPFFNCMYADNKVQFVVRESDGTVHTIYSNADSVPYNNWSHIVFTYNGTIQKIFVNNVEQDDTESWTGTIYSVVTHNIRIGNNVDLTRTFDGIIDEVYIRNESCSAAEVSKLWNDGAGNQYPFVVDTCTCAGLNNNWEIDMADNCEITEACDLGTGTLSFTGAGWCKCNASVDTTNLGDPGASGTLYIQDSCKITID